MQKNLYSLMLTDEVVARIDALASQNGTNRSNMINQILAEYVSYTTPEMKINHIFEHFNQLINSQIFSLVSSQNERVLSLKTSLAYKYNPTIKYGVELYRNPTNVIGELKVLFRTQSPELIYKLNSFFDLFIAIEKKYLPISPTYTFEGTKYSRTLIIPKNTYYSNEETARAINDYVKNFDAMLKKYLLDEYVEVKQVENDYKIFLTKSKVI